MPITASTSLRQAWRTCARTSPLLRSSVRLYSTETEKLRRTGLYDYHVKNGGKMVSFAGYAMPLSYGDVGAVASHNHVRESAGLFDVGHMVQSKFIGPQAQSFLEWLTPSDLTTLGTYHSTLSVLLNDSGGIIDDCIITKLPNDTFHVVTNAGRGARDVEWIENMRQSFLESESLDREGVEFMAMQGQGLLALQGPRAKDVLGKHADVDLGTIPFGKVGWISVGGCDVQVARGGYTGEDGFEISTHSKDTETIAELLNSDPAVQLTGLGARDSLRLEAGMCLYGQDLDEMTSPVEAGLSWVIGKNRREYKSFIGFDTVKEHLTNGPPRRRVGLLVEGAPARHGAQIYSDSSTDTPLEAIGSVTSGMPSPTLKQNVAMGYVANGMHKKGTELLVEVRGKMRRAKVVGMPFVPAKYYRG